MSIPTLLLPDFLLILLGFLLMRFTKWTAEFWDGLEKMVYYVLFPALLFYSTARTPFDFAITGKLLEVTLGATVVGIALGWLAKPLFSAGPMVFESGLQTAFRFNSYIALAIASRLGGEQGTSLMALIIGFAVPIANMAAVHALVHRSGGLAKELAKNPLLIATIAGIACNLLQVPIPEVLGITLSRIGNASIALGTSEVSLLELVGAYAPFANGGLGVSAHVVTRIRTDGGKVLYARQPDQLGQVIAPLRRSLRRAVNSSGRFTTLSEAQIELVLLVELAPGVTAPPAPPAGGPAAPPPFEPATEEMFTIRPPSPMKARTERMQ